jgi:hypothetical protein
VTTLVQAVQISLEKAGFQVDLVQIGKLDDRRTWKVTLKDGASDAQRGAAQTMVDAFALASFKPPRRVDFEDALDRLTDQEWSDLQSAIAGNVRLARWYERAKTRGSIDLSDPEVKTALAAVVAARLFTKARLAEIFAAEVE